MSSDEIKRFIENLQQLPTLPPIAIKLLDIIEDRKSSLRDMARLIESDQALASKVLRIANSAQFGHSREVSTVERATLVLGLDLVRSVALSVIVFDLFRTADGREFNLVEFWRHSAACAAASELFARQFGFPHPQEAFVAGLLHDLGKLVFVQWNREEYEKAIVETNGSHTRLLEVEEARFGIGHAQAGKMLMEYWRFPPVLVSAAWLHHQPLAQFGAHPRDQLAFIVQCANNLCRIQRFGASGNPAGEFDLEQLEQVSELSAEALNRVSSEVLRRVEEISKYFDWEGSTPQLYLSAVSRANEELARLNLELTHKSRQLMLQQLVMATTCRLQEALPVPMSVGKALEKVVELLSEAVPHRLLMGFLLHKRESVVECRLKVGAQGPIESMVLPLEPGLTDQLGQLKSGEQLSRVEQAMLRLGDGLALGAEVTEALRSARLILLPLESGGVTLGQILLEPETPSGRHLGEPLPGPLSPESLDLLRGYARAAALALERILLFETLEEQAEDLARMARKAQTAQAQLYQSDRLASVGRLAAGAAHEINNPLAAISAQAQLLLRRVKEEKDRRSLQVILDQSTRISKIISDLMGFARPAEPKIEPTLVKGVIERALGVVEGRIKVAGVEVRKEFQADLPLIAADAKQLEQVFLNLTMNALQAMKSGGTLTIRLGLEEPPGRLHIEFSDTGVGIEPKDLPSIFDPFYTTKKEGEGMGLGLAICHSIIESHRGQITASSEPGRGTTFTILLPLGGASEARRLQSDLSRQLRSIPEERRASAGSILVVDDEEALRTVLAESLSSEGFSVDLASDGTEGLDCLSRTTYDVMLLDLRMPRLEGMELLSTVRRTAPRMPVIVISGLAHEHEFKAAREAGAFACLKKPFDVDEVLRTVRRAMKSGRELLKNTQNRIA